MRLKIIFAPLAFLVAIVVSIWYIWPDFQEIKAKMDLNKLSQASLDSVVQKKNNVESLRVDLDRNKDKENFILKFLPNNKNEEGLIDGLNYLATDSGLTLVNIGLEAVQDDAAQTAIEATPVAPPAIPVGQAPVVGVPTDSVPVIPAASPLKMKFINAKISVSGKYENIKIFLGQIYKMENQNKITAMDVSKINGTSQDGTPAASDLLLANMTIKFGYLPDIHSEGGAFYPVFSQTNFNFDNYSKIKDSITEKIPALDEGQKGKSNPFIP